MRSVTLTDDEVSMIAYALTEMSNRRQEESIENRNTEYALACRVEAQAHRNLANRIRDCNVVPNPARK